MKTFARLFILAVFQFGGVAPVILLAQAPAITEFSPTSGPVNSSVLIVGTNFDPNPSNNIVFFGGVRAVVAVASSETLTVAVPRGASYGSISVTTNQLTGYSQEYFDPTFHSFQVFDSASFAPPVEIQSGSCTNYVAISDLDGDGNLDLIAANGCDDSIAVFRNTSSPGHFDFAPKVSLPVGLWATYIAVGDLDGDGRPDLVIANSNSNTISIYRNTSIPDSISFAARMDLPTGGRPGTVVINDLDGDGKPDIVIANLNDGSLTVYQNTTAGGVVSFASAQTYWTGGSLNNVAVGDLDNDQKPDMVVGRGNTVSVFHNISTIGNILFDTRIDFAIGDQTGSVTLGDIDGDGRLDLAAAGNDSASVFRNTSAGGTISFAARLDSATGIAPTDVTVGDLNGDGKPDLVVISNLFMSLSVLRNTTTGSSISFASQVPYPAPFAPSRAAIGDLDGDGIPDMAVAGLFDGVVSLLRNTPPSPRVRFTVQDRWNLVSVPSRASNYGKELLFPTAASNALAYEGSYVRDDTLANGVGYWMKFNGAQSISIEGLLITQDSIEVHAGWNLIGSISSPVAAASVGSIPGGIRTSDFFAYNKGYHVSDTIQSGEGYWVKVASDCKLILSSGSSTFPKLSSSARRIRIVPTSEMPPPPPGEEETATYGMPTDFTFEQNYPNPFNPTTTINYGLPAPSNVRISIYNVLGQVVAVVADGVQDAGYQTAEWNAGSASSGIYFYRIEATSVSDPTKSFTQVKKMLMIK
jgi:hypothetical protein